MTQIDKLHPPERFREGTGTYFTQALFFETNHSNKERCLYTLKDSEYKGLPSLYRYYMDEEDPTEYIFSQKYLASWAHWKNLCSLEWFKPYIERWREELELLIKAKALKQIKRKASSDQKESFMAQKFLLEKGWEPKDTKNPRGRPSKDQINQAAQDIALDDSRILEDLERISTNREVLN